MALTVLPPSAFLYAKKPRFNKYGVAQLVRLSCTLNQAQILYSQGLVTRRELTRFITIWENSTFRTNSLSQENLFAIGGLAAVERRYKRAQLLHAAWRKKVLISMAKDCLAELTK
jgi:hypothetical protein